MPRETPLSLIHLRNMLTVKEAGATVLFLAPGFYHGAETVDDLVDFIVARALDQLGLEVEHVKRWGKASEVSVNYESGQLAPDNVRRMFDRIAPVYDAMNRTMTAGLDRRWRRLTAEAVVRPGDEVLDACCGTGDLAIAGARCGRPRHRARLLGAHARARAAQGAESRVDPRRCARAALRGCELRRGDRGLRRSERRRPAARPRRAAPRSPSGRTARASSRSPARAVFSRPSIASGSTESCRLLGKLLARWVCLHVPPGERAALPRARGAGGADRGGRLSRGSLPALRGQHRRAAHGGSGLSALAEIREAPGLDAYLGELEDRLGACGRRLPRRRRGGRCGGARRRREAAAAAARVPLGAARVGAAGGRRRRGRAHPPRDAHARRPHRPAPPCAAAMHRPGRRTAQKPHEQRATTSSRVRSPSSRPRRSAEALAVLANATLCLARGEAMQRSQRFDPDTTIEAYLERCTLKTGKLFEAACRLAGGSGVVRARARRRVPDHRRHPRLLGRDDRDRQDRRHRSA